MTSGGAVLVQPERLSNALALAEASLRALSGIFLAAADDPLKMDLPPLIGNGGAAVTPETLRVFGALYLQAELEQTGIILVADSLAEARFSLPIRDQNAVRKLEAYADAGRRWFKAEQRALLFARAFGVGAAATVSRGNDVNQEFEHRFATFCDALDRYSALRASSLRGVAPSSAMIRRAAADLLMNLANRQHGNTLLAATRIQQQLQAAIHVLSHKGVAEYFAVRGMWSVVRTALGDRTPDLGRLISRGKSGQQLLHWLGKVSPKLAQGSSLDSELGASSAVFLWASQWLSATGAPTRAGQGVVM